MQCREFPDAEKAREGAEEGECLGCNLLMVDVQCTRLRSGRVVCRQCPDAKRERGSGSASRPRR